MLASATTPPAVRTPAVVRIAKRLTHLKAGRSIVSGGIGPVLLTRCDTTDVRFPKACFRHGFCVTRVRNNYLEEA